MAFDKVSYDKGFIKEHYDRIEFTVPKGKRDEFKAFAKKQGIPMAELIVLAVKAQYGIDLSK